MRPHLDVLSQEEKAQIHARSLALLRETGLRVESQKARQVLRDAGARVDEGARRVWLAESLVEKALQGCPREFTLGGRRPGWSLAMNRGGCTLCADGTGIHVLDAATGGRRTSTQADWQSATRLIDALDDVGVYWTMVDPGLSKAVPAEGVRFWRQVFSQFSKHVQDSVDRPDEATWLLEVLQIVFGSRATIEREHPFSFLYCPVSPLILEGQATDACLSVLDWDIPIAVMPMPLMGATAPASLISTLLLANAEVLATLTLIQAARPGTPCLYAPVPALVNPRTWRFSGGEIEHALLGAAVTEMARFYGLPAESSSGGTDEPTIGLQSCYETALNWAMPMLSRPDILVGPGLIDGSTVLCLQQILIDVEIFRRGVRLNRGIAGEPSSWLDELIHDAGPGGSFVTQRSTRDALRAGEWYLSSLGHHDTFERWLAAGRPRLLDQATARVTEILAEHHPLPLSREAEQELDHLEARVRDLPPTPA